MSEGMASTKTDSKIKTLIFAGTYNEYAKFLTKRGIDVTRARDLGYWNGFAPTCGIHFDKVIITGSFRQRHDAPAYFRRGCTSLAQAGRVVYDDLPTGWAHLQYDSSGHPILKDADGHLRCNWCRQRANETYWGGFCYDCGRKDGVMANAKPHKMKPMIKNVPITLITGTIPNLRNQGEIWKLSKANSPMWTEQWGYQGSAKAPYIISHRTEGVNGGTTSDGWACSCPNFIRNMPRTPCKHILNVRLKEGISVNKAEVKMANVDKKQLADFEKWQREQAAKKKVDPTAGVKLNIFGSTGRKFR